MQMFNGLTMGLLDFYNVNLNTETGNNNLDDAPIDYYSQLNDYAKRINEITDALADSNQANDSEKKEEGAKLIQDMEMRFNNRVDEYFKTHLDELRAFKATIDSCINRLGVSGNLNDDEYDRLVGYSEKIDNFLKANGGGDDGNENVDVNQGQDKSQDNNQDSSDEQTNNDVVQTNQNDGENSGTALDGNNVIILNGGESSTPDAVTQGNSVNGNANEQLEGNNNESQDGNNINELTGIDEKGGIFYERIDTSKETTKIDNLLKKLGDHVNNEDPKITAYRETLNNIKKAIEHPNSNNTKALQRYILADLIKRNQDRKTFLVKNFKGSKPGNPDGLFGQHTLDGVNTFLTNLEEDINSSVDNSKAAESSATEGNNGAPEKPKAPDYPLTLELNDIKKREDGDAKPSYGSQLQRERPGEGQPETPDGKKLYETIEKIKELQSIIDSCKDIEGVGGDIGKLKTNLENIQAVIDNTTVENVKKLQNFISKNLEGDNYKPTFDSLNKKSSGFDGRFGESTLKGLDIILGKVDGYLSKVGDYGKNMETYNNALKEESTKDDAEKGKTEPKEKTEKAPTNTAPLKMKENGTEKTYLVMENSDDLKVQCNLPGATFYSTESFTPSEGEEDSIYTTNSTKVEINGDREYYMKLSNRPYDTYQVKLDANGNICPTAKNVASGAPILLKDNESCKRYLYNKLPDQLKTKGDQIVIKWNGSDYTIGFKGHDKTLTIEPMTIDEKWIGSLTDSLALLNFTNYLRINKDIHNIEFINNNPNLKVTDNGDLYVKVKRKGNINHDEQGKGWRKVDKDEFGLNGIDPKDLEKFKKYNNHEDWNDNWDNKKENKYYKL